MILTQEKKDRIYNALIIGMDLSDAYIYAGLTPTEVEAVSNDTELQLEWKRMGKEFEYGLLQRITEISKKQERVGKEAATTWMLEHMVPRYGSKAAPEVGTININIKEDAQDDECVTVVGDNDKPAEEENA